MTTKQLDADSQNIIELIPGGSSKFYIHFFLDYPIFSYFIEILDIHKVIVLIAMLRQKYTSQGEPKKKYL